jgi:hypothetical protein
MIFYYEQWLEKWKKKILEVRYNIKTYFEFEISFSSFVMIRVVHIYNYMYIYAVIMCFRNKVSF